MSDIDDDLEAELQQAEEGVSVDEAVEEIRAEAEGGMASSSTILRLDDSMGGAENEDDGVTVTPLDASALGIERDGQGRGAEGFSYEQTVEEANESHVDATGIYSYRSVMIADVLLFVLLLLGDFGIAAGITVLFGLVRGQNVFWSMLVTTNSATACLLFLLLPWLAILWVVKPWRASTRLPHVVFTFLLTYVAVFAISVTSIVLLAVITHSIFQLLIFLGDFVSHGGQVAMLTVAITTYISFAVIWVTITCLAVAMAIGFVLWLLYAKLAEIRVRLGCILHGATAGLAAGCAAVSIFLIVQITIVLILTVQEVEDDGAEEVYKGGMIGIKAALDAIMMLTTVIVYVIAGLWVSYGCAISFFREQELANRLGGHRVTDDEDEDIVRGYAWWKVLLPATALLVVFNVLVRGIGGFFSGWQWFTEEVRVVLLAQICLYPLSTVVAIIALGITVWKLKRTAAIPNYYSQILVNSEF